MTYYSIFTRFLLILIVTFAASFVVWSLTTNKTTSKPPLPMPAKLAPPSPTPTPIPSQKILPTNYHIFQSFNNCGPAALSMALSHYGINESQEVLGQSLRPYQNPQGDNDDKSVTLEELANESEKYGFIPYHRPNGTTKLVEQFIANGIPVITRTLLTENEDIGHYRVVKGYDQTTKTLLQDDSLQGENLNYSYNDFNAIWKKFNYEYLVLVPKDKELIAETILGEDADPKTAWQRAVQTSESELNTNPNDIYSRFNLSVALYKTGDFKGSVEEFEKVKSQLPFRTLWYQIEPIKAYYELGNYDKVFAITDSILNRYNAAFSELYILRGKIYQKQGDLKLARREFERAVFYNNNLQEAKDALSSIKTH